LALVRIWEVQLFLPQRLERHRQLPSKLRTLQLPLLTCTTTLHYTHPVQLRDRASTHRLVVFRSIRLSISHHVRRRQDSAPCFLGLGQERKPFHHRPPVHSAGPLQTTELLSATASKSSQLLRYARNSSPRSPSSVPPAVSASRSLSSSSSTPS
jgi:hypothetical protein